MTKIIGLVGGRGSGKTTVAERLVFHYDADTYAIADEIKSLAQELFHLSEEQLYGTQERKELLDPRWHMTPRHMVQRTGDALRQVFGDTFLVERVLAAIDEDAPKLAVISDVRYRHEAAVLSARGAILWRLHYPEGVNVKPMEHASETEWMQIDADHEIRPKNIGRLELYHHVQKACELFDV